MKNKATYINQTKNSNKFWEYEIGTDYRVTVRYGRIGRKVNERIKDFTSRYSAEAHVTKKLREKAKKGYVEKTKKDLKEETQTANDIGTANKIVKITWVRRLGNSQLKELSGYDPEQWVYIELMDSWDKNKQTGENIVKHILLSKSECHQLTNISKSGKTFSFTSLHRGARNLADGLRRHLSRLAKEIRKVVTMKFGDLGTRDLGLGGSADKPMAIEFSDSDYEEITEAVGDESASGDVIQTLAALGVRKLDLF